MQLPRVSGFEPITTFRASMRWASMKLGVVAALVAGYAAMYPQSLPGLSSYLPVPLQPFGQAAISGAVFLVIYYTRNTKKAD